MRYLILIVLLGAFLRILMLDQKPLGITADEIQQAYASYSILKTGADEWGDFLPLNPRSLGEYKPALYSYLIIPFQVVLGMNIMTTRLPSAIAGATLVLVVYFLTLRLFNHKKIALLSALILSISYWHITFSRFAWESNIGLLFFALGLLLFLRGFDKKTSFLFSALLFGLSVISYNSFKLFTPLFVAGIVLIYFKDLKKIPAKYLLGSASIFLIFILILSYGWIFSGSGRRAADAAIYNTENLGALRQLQIEDKLPNPLNRIINNKPTYLATQFTQNYLGYFSTTFLTSTNRGDNSLFNLPGIWLISLWELIFLILGIFYLIKDKNQKKKLIFLWLLLAPIPAALTRDYMQTLRVENLLLLFPILTAFGIYNSFAFIKEKKIYKIALIGLSTIILWNFIYNLDFYLFHQFNRQFGGLKFGYGEAIKFAEENKDQYNKVIFTKQHSNPQIFVAFYTKMDPNTFQKYSKDWKHFESDGLKFVDMIDMNLDKYYFQNIDWQKVRSEKSALIIASNEELPEDLKPLKTIKDPAGNVIFKIIDTAER